MSRFRARFANRHVILPVIHVSTLAQARRNVQMARDAGTDGTFLISHGHVTDGELLGILAEVRTAHPGWWLGVNCLSLPPQEVFARLGNGADGVWVDDGLIDEEDETQQNAREVLAAREKSGFTGLYFGGVAFKYQLPVLDLARAASLAVPFMDVVTTSGPGTGQAASPEKIRTMKQAIGETPLAIASGISPENVGDYLPWGDCFLVATGVSYTFEELDPGRLKDLVQVVRAWKPRIPTND